MPQTILLAEDEEILRRAAKRLLERFGYKVLLARDGMEALEILTAKERKVDIVISDAAMPRLDGAGLYRELKRRGNMVPFVFASGLSPKEVEEEFGSLEPGFGFIQKPWAVQEVARIVRQVLDGPTAGTPV